jgi:hypothetical protein
MRPESVIGLVGLAVAVLAWLVPQDRIGYQLKFGLLGFAIAVLALSVWQYIRGLWQDRRKQNALDDLSEAVSRAIRDLVNKPRTSPAGMDAFASALAEEYARWCEEVNQTLANTTFFTKSDLLHFQRLGMITPIVMTGHPGADHTLSMLHLKMERLRELIARHSPRH